MKKKLKVARARVREAVETELAFINTNHPDFVGLTFLTNDVQATHPSPFLFSSFLLSLSPSL